MLKDYSLDELKKNVSCVLNAILIYFHLKSLKKKKKKKQRIYSWHKLCIFHIVQSYCKPSLWYQFFNNVIIEHLRVSFWMNERNTYHECFVNEAVILLFTIEGFWIFICLKPCKH